MSETLYRKYRTRTLKETVGQDHITKTLDSAISRGKISHAYLLTGPRGVGKTSVARIIAHQINGLEYTDDSSNVDIIEIDAASNRRIDEIRDLKEKVNVLPLQLKYKVYIIDEVHMLTKEAFNALLKTLEEPPAHVVFILATTDSHKLPETIISRTQRFNFKYITTDDVVEHLKFIAKKEKISVDDDALEVIAVEGKGSFRDSIGLLDMVASSGQKITKSYVEEILNLPSMQDIDHLIELLGGQGKPSQIIESLDNFYGKGVLPDVVASQVSSVIKRSILEDRLSIDYMSALNLIDQLSEVEAAVNPKTKLDITLLSMASSNPVAKKQNSAQLTVNPEVDIVIEPLPEVPESELNYPLEQNETYTKQPAIKEDELDDNNAQTAEPAKKIKNASTAKQSSNLKKRAIDEELWQQALIELKKKNNTLYGSVRIAATEFNEDVIVLNFKYKLHFKKLSEQENYNILYKILKDLTGNEKIDLKLNLNGDATLTQLESDLPTTSPQTGNDLDNISNIFNGAELLES